MHRRAFVQSALTVEAPETLRQMLLLGVDEIALTLARREEIDCFRERDRERRPWAYI